MGTEGFYFYFLGGGGVEIFVTPEVIVATIGHQDKYLLPQQKYSLPEMKYSLTQRQHELPQK